MKVMAESQNAFMSRPWGDGSEVYHYQQGLFEAWKSAGGKTIDITFIPTVLRQVIGRMKLCFSIGRHKRKVLILASGRLDSVAWPLCYFYEIVPVVWDVWPFQFKHLVNFVRRNRVKTIFCTASQTARDIARAVPGVHAIWLPEGIDVKSYPMGKKLVERSIDILEYGRHMKPVHRALVSSPQAKTWRHVYDDKEGIVFPKFSSFAEALRDAKIVICYPQCDTNPSRAGNIETLTQRYWECMLSGVLMVGRAPKELIDLCGYDPVVGFLTASADEEVYKILLDIGSYQNLIARNRSTAQNKASWTVRVNDMVKEMGVIG